MKTLIKKIPVEVSGDGYDKVNSSGIIEFNRLDNGQVSFCEIKIIKNKSIIVDIEGDGYISMSSDFSARNKTLEIRDTCIVYFSIGSYSVRIFNSINIIGFSVAYNNANKYAFSLALSTIANAPFIEEISADSISTFRGDLNELKENSDIKKYDLNRNYISGDIKYINKNATVVRLYNSSVYGDIATLEAYSFGDDHSFTNTQVSGDVSNLARWEKTTIFYIGNSQISGTLESLIEKIISIGRFSEVLYSIYNANWTLNGIKQTHMLNFCIKSKQEADVCSEGNVIAQYNGSWHYL